MLRLTLLFASVFLINNCQTKPNIESNSKVSEQSFYKMRIIRVALEQAEKPSVSWEPQQRDCAGFIRFVYKSAISSNKPLWSSWENQKVPYANAELLVTKNFTRIANEINESIQTGDILVFRRDDQKKEDQWHLMMLMESPWDQNKWLVTYHNGARDESGGVKKVWLNELLSTNQENWKPVKENKNYVGVYRWNHWAK